MRTLRWLIALCVVIAEVPNPAAASAGICPESRWLGEAGADGSDPFRAFLELRCSDVAIEGALHAPIGVFPVKGRLPAGDDLVLQVQGDGVEGTITARVSGATFVGRFVFGPDKGGIRLSRNDAATAAAIAPQAVDEKLDLTAAQWREDLRFFAAEIAKRHGNAFHRVSKPTFERAVARLDSDIPNLSGNETAARLLQLTAMIGDGHTSVRLPAKARKLPFVAMWFGKELRIVQALAGSEGLLGARIDAVGGIPIAEVDRRLRTFASQGENEWFFLAVTPYLLIRADVLKAADVVKAVAPVTLRLSFDGGQPGDIALPAASWPEKPDWRYLDGAPPLYQRRPGDAFWSETWPDKQAVYANFRRYDELGANTKALMAALDQARPKRFILDMRDNGGGDFTKVRDILIPEITARPWLDKPGAFYVVINRDVFSAAMTNAIDFRQRTKARLVGEPIGERPNSWQEVRSSALPNSALTIRYSTKFYRFLPGDPDTVTPDKRIDPDWQSFSKGRDPAIEWILAQ